MATLSHLAMDYFFNRPTSTGRFHNEVSEKADRADQLVSRLSCDISCTYP